MRDFHGVSCRSGSTNSSSFQPTKTRYKVSTEMKNQERSMESAFRCISMRLLLVLAVLALSVGAFAQGGTGELSGLVTDTTGAVVSGVGVKLSNSATGEVRTTVTT